MIIIKYLKKRSRSDRSRESKRAAGKKSYQLATASTFHWATSDSGVSRVNARGGCRIGQWGSANTSVVTRSSLRRSRPIDAGEQGKIHSPPLRLRQYALYSIHDTIRDTIYFTFVYFTTSSCETTVLQTICLATSIYLSNISFLRLKYSCWSIAFRPLGNKTRRPNLSNAVLK